MGHQVAIEYQPLIRELPAQERPRERLRQSGAASLSNAELLAIILRVGATSESVLNLATRLLARFGGLAGLAKASFGELCNEHGLGEAKASQIKAAFELGLRLHSRQAMGRSVIKSPADVANILQSDMSLLEQEELRLVLLDTKNQVLSTPLVYKGSVNSSLIRIAELFKDPIKENCPAFIVVHNHPSGDPTPSPEDIKITEQINQAGKILDIEVLDHIIIGHQNYISLKEQRLGFD
jgi:DNA repair protein RadC